MGKNLQKQFPFRTDEEIIKKIDFIANHNTRNRNQQIEHVLKQCIYDFEKLNGTLNIDENGQVTLEKQNHLNLMGKLSQSKIG